MNGSSQIRASFSDDGRFVISGSEDGQVFIWDSGMAPRPETLNLSAESPSSTRRATLYSSHVFLGHTERFADADDLVGRQGAGTRVVFISAICMVVVQRRKHPVRLSNRERMMLLNSPWDHKRTSPKDTSRVEKPEEI